MRFRVTRWRALLAEQQNLSIGDHERLFGYHEGGGRIIAEGPPEEIVKVEASHTGHYLRPVLDAHAARRARGLAPASAPRNGRGVRSRKASGDLLG